MSAPKTFEEFLVESLGRRKDFTFMQHMGTLLEVAGWDGRGPRPSVMVHPDGTLTIEGQRPTLRLTQRHDPYNWSVNGDAASVHNFADDPAFKGKRRAERFGYYVVGGEWVTGFETKEAAGEAALTAILGES